jgi:hypothetical protein
MDLPAWAGLQLTHAGRMTGHSVDANMASLPKSMWAMRVGRRRRNRKKRAGSESLSVQQDPLGAVMALDSSRGVNVCAIY